MDHETDNPASEEVPLRVSAAGPEATDPLLGEIRRLETDLEGLRRELAWSQRLSSLGTMAAVIAHEFNNILTPISTYAQLALEYPDDRELAHKAMLAAVEGVERASKISSSVLDLCRDEPGDELRCSLSETIESSLACMARDPGKDGIELTLDVPQAEVAMRSTDLQQVMVNLFINARKAMLSTRRTSHKLTVVARVEAQRVCLSVSDTGPGIPEAVRGRLFEPFATCPAIHETSLGERAGDDDGSSRPGTGLGLSICRDLLERAGGSIAVGASAEGGASFHLILPLA